MIISKIYTQLFFLALLLPLTAQADRSAPWVGNSIDGKPCTGDGQGYGPYDYTQRGSLPAYNLKVVEEHHFTPMVENLIHGQESPLEGDLDYTLRAWPNHHKALLSVIKFQLNVKNKLAFGKLKTPVECYFQRALHFSPSDSISHSLFAYYLRKMGFPDKAVKYYEKALELDPGNEKIAYSFSLLLIDLKRYEEAVKYAKIAYQNNKTPSGLKQKLVKLGVWN
jgi:tetratricopeptide (TPR) repeat protein